MSEEYDPTKYPRVAVAVDVVVLTLRSGRLCLRTVTRTKEPFAGARALPGTFLRPNETAHESASRVLRDKAGLVGVAHLEQLRTFSMPDRDPRMRVVSIAHLSFGPVADETSVEGADWLPVDGVIAEAALAFDHAAIAIEGLVRAADKLEYTTLATRFLPYEFTLPELMQVYEAVWGYQLNKGNFYRKVKASKGFIEATGEHRGKATLYRAGDATTLYPPIRREGGSW